MNPQECSICLTDSINILNKCTTQCSHNFCKDCLDKWFDKGKSSCPMCRQTLQYFNHNGENTRIISIEKPITINQQPIPTSFQRVTITKGLYTSLVFSSIALITSNSLTIFWFLLYCN